MNPSLMLFVAIWTLAVIAAVGLGCLQGRYELRRRPWVVAINCIAYDNGTVGFRVAA